MKKPISFTARLEPGPIYVIYQDPKKPMEYSSEEEFNHSLQSRPLESIDTLHIPVELKGFCSMSLMLKYDRSSGKWNVTRGKQPYFDFLPDPGEGLVERFWNELRNIIAPPDSPGPQAKYMM